jgi:hypothetical protein
MVLFRHAKNGRFSRWWSGETFIVKLHDTCEIRNEIWKGARWSSFPALGQGSEKRDLFFGRRMEVHQLSPSGTNIPEYPGT